jgi:hypothetical protein
MCGNKGHLTLYIAEKYSTARLASSTGIVQEHGYSSGKVDWVQENAEIQVDNDNYHFDSGI